MANGQFTQAGASIEIVPGRAIGPSHLGMTVEQLGQAVRTWTDATKTSVDLGIEAWFDENGHCSKLSIRVFNNKHTVMLGGYNVNDIDEATLLKLFELLYPGVEVHRSYASRSLPALGLETVKWESSDDWIDSFFVVPPVASS